MEKAILMSIQPQYVAKILNGEQTIEVRKKFPKDYVGWVYIYCTKGKEKLYDDYPNMANGRYKISKVLQTNDYLNGKVVARFWCDKVEEIYPEFEKEGDYEMGVSDIWGYHTQTFQTEDELLKSASIKYEDFYEYFDKDFIYCSEGYAIHISKLEVFDKPMLTTMFRKLEFYKNVYDNDGNRLSLFEILRRYSIAKAPQSWCYIYE